MNETTPKRDPVEQLAEEFLTRLRSGEHPALTEYARRYPELEEEIRELFPALVMMEQARPVPEAVAESQTADGRPLERLGDYHIMREVGRGGMGIVYEAEQESLGRHVALKVLPFQFAGDATALQRFRREARSAARLHHTNIVPVFDVGECQGTHYYAMQFIRGQSLDEVLTELKRLRSQRRDRQVDPAAPRAAANGPLTVSLAHGLLTGQFAIGSAEIGVATPTADTLITSPLPHAVQAVEKDGRPNGSSTKVASTSDFSTPGDSHYYRSVAHLGLQVAEALAYAHSQRVLHRDIKPSNLLLDNDGIVWVTDFGLAKEEGDDLTRSGDLVGTLRYMAPERFQGLADARSDIYSLGVTLYEMLTLKPAFEESDRGRLVMRVTHEEPIRPRKLDPYVPRDLETVVLKAIAKEQDRRYGCAADMAEDLRRFLADRPIRARRSRMWEHAWRWCRRNPLPAGLSAAVLLLMAVVGVALPLALLLHRQRNRAVGAEATANMLLGRAQKAEAEFEFASHLARAAAYRHAGQAGQSFKSLEEVKQALRVVQEGNLGPEALLAVRNEAIACLCLPDLAVFKTLNALHAGTTAFAIDSPFRLCAWVDVHDQIALCRVSDGQVRYRLSTDGPPESYFPLQFSSDGRFLHFQTNGLGHSCLWKLGNSAQDCVPLLRDRHGAFAFRPDGRRYVAGYDDGAIRLFDSESGKELRRYPAAWVTGSRLYWHPRRPWLVSGYKRDWRILDLDTGRTKPLPLPPRKSFYNFAWHPHGEVAALISADNKVYLWDTPRRRLLCPPLEAGDNAGLSACFNHTGDRLLTTNWSSAWRLWDTRTGQLLLSMPSGGNYLAFSQDDALVAAEITPPTVTLFRMRPGREFRTLLPPTSKERYLRRGVQCLDASGRWYPVARADGKVVLLDTQTGMVEGALPGEAPLGFGPDGSLWTYGHDGMLRWRRSVDLQGRRCRLGPPECVLASTNADLHALSSDGRMLAVPEYYWGALLLDLFTGRTRRLGPQKDVRNCAFSPDGRWVATGSHWPTGWGASAKVWDARTGRHAKDLPLVGGSCGVLFSPDSQWLFTTGEMPRLWQVGTWREGPPLGGTPHNSYAAFSTDSRLLALGDAPGVVRLLAPSTGAEVARLSAPVKGELMPCCFSPSGAELVTMDESGAVHIFDLHAIRTQLAALGLDWDPTSIPEAPATGPTYGWEVRGAEFGSPGYWRQQVGLHSFFLSLRPVDAEAAMRRGTAYYRLGKISEAANDYEWALRLLAASKKHGSLRALIPVKELNNLAWQLGGQRANENDGRTALWLAEMAATAAPELYIYRNTLGVVNYRLGRYCEAQKHFQESLRLGQDEAAAFDLYFLAMCHERLGNHIQARKSYDQAVRWVERNKGKLPSYWATDLGWIRAEADGVLGRP